jgi:serine kinase of HPr protein (carbohydrate metabolism regulator)
MFEPTEKESIIEYFNQNSSEEVLLNVFGIKLLILCDSLVVRNKIAIELLMRGHRLIINNILTDIQFVVKLADMDYKKNYGHINIEEQYIENLGMVVPVLYLPSESEINIPHIIETASINERLKDMGCTSDELFEIKYK